MTAKCCPGVEAGDREKEAGRRRWKTRNSHAGSAKCGKEIGKRGCKESRSERDSKVALRHSSLDQTSGESDVRIENNGTRVHERKRQEGIMLREREREVQSRLRLRVPAIQ